MARVRGVWMTRSTRAQWLVSVRSLLGDNTAALTVVVVVRRAARAAADAKGPEEKSGEGERNSEPGRDEHVLAHGDFDAVGSQGGTGGGFHDGEKDGGSHRGGEGEEEGQDGEESGDAASPAAADGEDADQDFETGDDEGDDVCDEHPFGDIFVDVHGLVVAAG